MRRFGSIAAFVEFLTTRPAAVELAEKKAMDQAGEMLAAHAQAMIGTEQESWEPLATSTVEEKRRLGYTGRLSSTDPLYRTGELRASIQSKATSEKVTLYSDDPIAEYQEFGTPRIPPRPFIGSTMFAEGTNAADMVANHVLGAAVGASGPLKQVQGHPGSADGQ